MITAVVEQQSRSRDAEGKEVEVEGLMFSLCLIRSTTAGSLLKGSSNCILFLLVFHNLGR